MRAPGGWEDFGPSSDDREGFLVCETPGRPSWEPLPKINSDPQHTHTPFSLKFREVPAHVDNPRLVCAPFPRSLIHTSVQSRAVIQNASPWDTRNVKHRCPHSGSPSSHPHTATALSPSYAFKRSHMLPLAPTQHGQHSQPVTHMLAWRHFQILPHTPNSSLNTIKDHL